MNFESITFTNSGYLDFTENLLTSSKVNKVNLNLNIYTLDEKATTYFQNIHDKITILEEGNEYEELQEFKAGGFGDLMVKKFECIYRSLLLNDYVLYIDGDITVKHNFTDTLLDISIKNNLDILFQNDRNPKKPLLRNVCAGFMLIKSNKKTLKFFNPGQKVIKKIIKYRTFDQTHVNKSLSKFKYQILPLDKFPNGPYFYENFEEIEPWMIHFNYVTGEEKKELMRKYDEWYL